MTWIEVGDRVFTRRYAFLDQQIGVVLDGDDVLLVDTRSGPAHAREVVAEVRELTPNPVSIVVDTHWHWDHAFGNHALRPATIWGHVRTAERLRAEGDARLAQVRRHAAELEGLAEALADVVIDPPDRTFAETATVMVGDRVVELAFHGRAHTDADISVHVPDAGVLFAGDLLEADASPSFGDGYPLEWPDAVERLLPLANGAVVPGHGSVGGRAFVEDQLTAQRAIAALARQIHAGELELEAAIAAAPFTEEATREAFERGLAQLRGELR
ncbi:MAG TPA: MBL fold metallo-hydrolase [Candidatus Limnocylindrales bacterium]|nr:MBL fold metallo-hydrolase [Candidatus Limnocylindrales bacterium]